MKDEVEEIVRVVGGDAAKVRAHVLQQVARLQNPLLAYTYAQPWATNRAETVRALQAAYDALEAFGDYELLTLLAAKIQQIKRPTRSAAALAKHRAKKQKTKAQPANELLKHRVAIATYDIFDKFSKKRPTSTKPSNTAGAFVFAAEYLLELVAPKLEQKSMQRACQWVLDERKHHSQARWP
jgi:hypothetical protein